MQEFEKLRKLIDACADDVDKFDNGNKSAGTRIRKAMQNIKAQAQDVRKEVLDFKNKGK